CIGLSLDFFFQAEDGIRDFHVTGVQTCALPIFFANRLPHPVLQGLEHPHSQDVSVNDAFRPVSAYWDRIYRPEQVLSALPRAMQVLTDPALTGAVTICLPQDVQTEAYDFPENFFKKRVWRIRR